MEVLLVKLNPGRLVGTIVVRVVIGIFRDVDSITGSVAVGIVSVIEMGMLGRSS